MNLKKFAPLLLVALVLGGGFWIDQRRAAQASRLTGFFESQPTSVASRLPGRVAKILIHEGDSVHRGQKLLILEAEPDVASLSARVDQAAQATAALEEVRRGPRAEEIGRQEAAVAEASAELEKLKRGSRPEEIAAAKARLESAEAVYRRAVAGARPQEREEARAAEELALQKLRAAERGLTSEERLQARARLDQAKASEDLARREWERVAYLFKEGAIAKQNLDRAEADYASARAKTFELAQANLRATRGTPPEELAQVREAYRQAKAQADLVAAGTREEDVAAARASMEEARSSLELAERGARIEDIRAAEARLRSAEAMLFELRNGSRREDVAQAKAAADAAAKQARSATATIGEQEVVAPFDGVVERIMVADGDLLTTGEPVVQMSDPTNIWLRVYVAEGQLTKIKVGDDAALQIDGVDGDVAAKVESISTKGEFTPANLQTPEERARQVFAVRIRLASKDPQVKAGMGATVRRMGQWP